MTDAVFTAADAAMVTIQARKREAMRGESWWQRRRRLRIERKKAYEAARLERDVPALIRSCLGHVRIAADRGWTWREVYVHEGSLKYRRKLLPRVAAELRKLGFSVGVCPTPPYTCGQDPSQPYLSISWPDKPPAS